jgi:hypothetical protein
MTKPKGSGTHLGDLQPDPSNRRTHNPRNIAMLVDALQKVGAARSIVIDEEGVILAGNGVAEASAQAGLTKLQIVEADGETIVAVRRRGLTPEQKRQLAIFDNRTAELAEWNVEMLVADLQAGDDLSAYFLPEEIEKLTGVFAAAQMAAPAMESGDRAHFQQMTFSLHDDQVETVKAALARAQADGCASEQNENTNGNALAHLAEAYLRG